MPDKISPIPAKKYRTVKEKVSIYPDKAVDKTVIDSLTKAGRGKLIGEPLRRPGMQDMYSPAQGDVIKRLMLKK